jgi:hypothetical protein
MINTAKAERRTLRFSSVAEMRGEVERVYAWAQAGEARMTGNWSVGTIFGHLAFWIEHIDDDKGVKISWFGRIMARVMKRQILYGKPMAGFRLAGAPAGTYGCEVMSLVDGYARLSRAMQRLERPDFPAHDRNFGAMRREDWLNLHFRHAELHLGFVSGPGA